MISNNLKLALRALLKNRFFSALNIAGLSLGLACFALIGLNTVDEFGFDRFHSKSDRLFRVVSTTAEGFRNEKAQKDVYLPMPLGPAMGADFGDIELFSRLRGWGGFVQSPTGLFEEKMSFVDADFLKMFDFGVKKGDAATALNEPQEVVLTEKMAQKLFGFTDAIGKTVTMKLFEAFEPFTVSAIVAEPPSNSSLQFDILLPFAKYAASKRGKTRPTAGRGSRT